jgi:anti-sigma regulatory factor (Ser/Thr protein kinase)
MHDELRLTLPNDLQELARVGELANSFLQRHRIPEKTLYSTNLALEEVLANVIRHAYDDEERHEISVCLRVAGGRVELLVVDDGREFDPLSAPEVDVRVPLEERQVGGLGLHLLRNLTSDIRYRRAAGRNHLHVVI